VRPSPFYMFAGVVSQPIKWLYRLRAEGVENVPKEGGFVLAANHLSNFDPWPLGLPLFPKRYLRFMAKSELFWWPLGPIIRSGGGFQVRRGEGDIEAMRTAIDLGTGRASERDSSRSTSRARTPARRASRSKPARRWSRPRSRGRSASRVSVPCACATANHSTSTVSTRARRPST
jgi:hypothetical protein